MAPLIADSRLILSRSGEFPSRACEERDRVFVDPKLDGHGLGRTELNANQFPTEHCAEPAVHLLGIDLRSFGQDHSERSLSEIARQICNPNRRAEDAPGGGEHLVGQRRVESQEDETEMPVVTPCASTFTAECLTHHARVCKASDTFKLKGSSFFEAKHDPER
ncbi:MAG TPA: hypothetical protein VFD71_06650 [Planctomycetota bacterium]|nr:hypothetical protein [Planctomycetota bacterium]